MDLYWIQVNIKLFDKKLNFMILDIKTKFLKLISKK